MALDDKFDDIKKLIDTGKEKGYLTYDQVNDLIPGDVHSPEDLDDLLARMLAATLLGDAVSVYMAFLNGVDPTPVEEIRWFKEQLARPQ